MFLLKDLPKVKFNSKSISFLTLIMFGLIIIYFWFINNTPNIETFINKKNNFTKCTFDDVYDKFYCDVYDNLYVNNARSKFENKIINTTIDKNSNILDIGCGTGDCINFCSSKGCKAIGIDSSNAMIEKASSKYPNAKFKKLDVNKAALEFDYEQFSTILCLYFTIYYIPNKVDFFKNCFKWLKPGGNLIIHLVNVNKFDPLADIQTEESFESPDKNSIHVQTDKWNYRSKFIIDKKEICKCNARLSNVKFKF